MDEKDFYLRSQIAIKLKERLTDPLIKRENDLVEKVSSLMKKLNEAMDGNKAEEAYQLFIDLATIAAEIASIQKARTEIAKFAFKIFNSSDINEFVSKLEFDLNLCIARNKFESDVMKKFETIMSGGK